MPTSWAGSTFTADVSASISLGRLWPSWGARVIQVLTTPRSGLEGDQDRTCHTLEAFSSLGSTRWRRFLQIQVCYTWSLYGSEEFLAINGKFVPEGEECNESFAFLFAFRELVSGVDSVHPTLSVAVDSIDVTCVSHCAGHDVTPVKDVDYNTSTCFLTTSWSDSGIHTDCSWLSKLRTFLVWDPQISPRYQVSDKFH